MIKSLLVMVLILVALMLGGYIKTKSDLNQNSNLKPQSIVSGMKLYHPFSPSSTDNIYSYKLENGKYVYFDFISSHPKVNLIELDNHFKILKSVRQI